MKKTKCFKTFLLLVLSAVLLFSAVPTNIYAASTIKADSYGNHANANNMMTNGYFTEYIEVVNKYYNPDICTYRSGKYGAGGYISLHFVVIDGVTTPAYCVEPGAPVHGEWTYNGSDGTASEDPYWKYLSANHKDVTKAISLAIGYTNKYKGAADFYGARAACQIIVWEFIGGYRDTNTLKVTNTALRNAVAGPRLEKYYDLISNDLTNHNVYPSFVSRTPTAAPTITLSYDEAKKEWGKTVTTSAGTVDMVDYAQLSGKGITAKKIDDKTVYLSSQNMLTDSGAYTVNKNLPKSLYAGDMYVWTTYSGGERGQCIVSGADNDPVPMYMKFATEPVYRNLEINYYDKYTGEVIYPQYKSTGILLDSSYDKTNRLYSTIEYNGINYIHCPELNDGDPISGTMDTDKVINLYYGYDHNVTVNYFDKYTNEKIAESYVSAQAEHLSDYDVSDNKLEEITFNNLQYKLDDSLTTGDAFSGTLNTDKIINLYYGYEHNVTVNYFDKYTNEKIADSFVSDSAEHNTDYDVTEHVFSSIDYESINYTIQPELTQGDAISGVLDSDKELDLYYGYDHKVTINYFDKYTNEKIAESFVSDSAEHNTEYDVSENKLDTIEFNDIHYMLDDSMTSGDTFTGTLDCDKEINLYYGYSHNITIEYRDESTGEIISETVSYIPENEHNSDYDKTSDTEVEIDGYVKTKVTGDPITGTLDTDKVIVVWYKKVITPLPETDDAISSFSLCGLAVCLVCGATLLFKKRKVSEK